MPAGKYIQLFHAVFFLLFLTGVSSCYLKRYFGTPDYFTRQPGTLILKNGEQIKGEISVNNLLGNSVIVQVYPEKKKKEYRVKEVAACRLDIGVFEPVSIGREIPKLYSQPVFMERLTPDSFSLSLYEAYQRQTNPNVTGDVSLPGGVEYDLQYYVHLPYDDSNVVWQLSTPLLATHLDRGLDSLFDQCPGLTQKIKSGNPAYHIYFSPQVEISKQVILGRLSAAAKQEKAKNIINVFAEYEKCRKKK